MNRVPFPHSSSSADPTAATSSREPSVVPEDWLAERPRVVCMMTTFFGSHSFGGDAAFVDRLARALARRGHEVHVIHCQDAFEATRGGVGPRAYEPPPGVTLHPLKSGLGVLSPLLTHQTGRPMLKTEPIRQLWRTIRPDLIHFHNLSLIGGPGLIDLAAQVVPDALRVMTAHEHWLVCPLSVLWTHDRRLCERPRCVSCTLRAKRPPQLWRAGDGLIRRGLDTLDALIVPSEATRRAHHERGVTRPIDVLPYFLPDDHQDGSDSPSSRGGWKGCRPYVAAAGRLVDYKGFDDAIRAMRFLPKLDLRLAGVGDQEQTLRGLVARLGLTNVHFEGALNASGVANLFRHARAVVVPSRVPETFGYVILEAFHEATPVIVRDLGAPPELVELSQGGLVFDDEASLVHALTCLSHDDALRKALGRRGHRARWGIWNESRHLTRFGRLLARRRASRSC